MNLLCWLGFHDWFGYKKDHRACWRCGREQKLTYIPDPSLPTGDYDWIDIQSSIAKARNEQ